MSRNDEYKETRNGRHFGQVEAIQTIVIQNHQSTFGWQIAQSSVSGENRM